MNTQSIEFLQILEAVIDARKDSDPSASYTAQLLSAGTSRIAQKVGEEAVELALASTEGAKEKIVAEAADLLYHVLVLLRNHDLSLTDVARELEGRHR